MSWTDRQRRMLAELGLPDWFGTAAPLAEPVAAPLTAPALDVAAGPSPSARLATDAATAVPGRPLPPAIASPMPASPGARPAPPPGRSAPAEPATVPTRDDIATLDWDALRGAVAACTACALCQGRTQTVFGVGHPSAHWMVVGEAPGEQEDRLGEPFVGKSGQLLDAMLQSIGLTRAASTPERQVYIANTLKCRPPGNRNPQPQELVKCEPFLIRQVALVQPRIILAMGRFAVQSLLRSTEAIGRLRGRVHRYQGVPLIVTYHPAYLLRNPEDKARAWEDLCLALETLEAGPPAAA
jgi:DNA polymerase